jgi:hypothetical protein
MFPRHLPIVFKVLFALFVAKRGPPSWRQL